MPRLNVLNSGVASKRVRLDGGPCASRALGVADSGNCVSRPSAMLNNLCFPSQLSIRQAASDDLSHANHEARSVVHEPVVKPERLFIDVTKQVERFHADVSSANGPLEQGPKILKRICMAVARDVLVEMVDHLMLKAIFHSPRMCEVVSIDFRAALDLSGHLRLNRRFLAIRNDGSADALRFLPARAFQNPENYRLAFTARPDVPTKTGRCMHVARLAADVGFVHFDFAAKVSSREIVLHCEANPTQHKPRRLLSNPQNGIAAPR